MQEATKPTSVQEMVDEILAGRPGEVTYYLGRLLEERVPVTEHGAVRNACLDSKAGEVATRRKAAKFVQERSAELRSIANAGKSRPQLCLF